MSIKTQRKRHPRSQRSTPHGQVNKTNGTPATPHRISTQTPHRNNTAPRPPGPGGSLDVSVKLTSTIEIKSDIPSIGSTAGVIATQSLRTEVAKEVQQAITRYASDTPSPRDRAGSARP
ncbi:hypothetical protein FHS27_006248 [Rhodopirellula rubra]|uniref:Uncharacterized protein n=1 Tax=Aporhodopirellula rubra TaxID=980271 RepID=A0A7W5E549_9BACT|nr:hypothetical protein [Aporhodopirellula rubra]MBB3210401.1 hypothetical protein [Aporhodopirellula rubra]